MTKHKISSLPDWARRHIKVIEDARDRERARADSLQSTIDKCLKFIERHQNTPRLFDRYQCIKCMEISTGAELVKGRCECGGVTFNTEDEQQMTVQQIIDREA